MNIRGIQIFFKYLSSSDILSFNLKLFNRSTFRQFLERNVDATTADDYIAISHVWGDPSTRPIKKVFVDGAGEIELSPAKTDILPILYRDDVCGKS